MPPTSALSDTRVETIRAWISAGASSECTNPDTGIEPETYHPAGWSDPDVHGLAAKLSEDTCVTCHGDTLEGGTVGVSCDSCHETGWRENCLYCHGNTDDGTGAPPADITGETSSSALSFSAHTAHVTTNLHAAYDCEQCHSKPTDVLTSGHLFIGDTTPAVAEVLFTGGLSTAATWNGSNSCSNLYCHGNGQGNNGTARIGDDETSCDSCHASLASSEDAWDRMDGKHADHLEEGLQCSECHQDTTTDNTSIATPAMHVNGNKDVVFEGSMVRTDGRCTGTCHSERHSSRSW